MTLFRLLDLLVMVLSSRGPGLTKHKAVCGTAVCFPFLGSGPAKPFLQFTIHSIYSSNSELSPLLVRNLDLLVKTLLSACSSLNKHGDVFGNGIRECLISLDSGSHTLSETVHSLSPIYFFRPPGQKFPPLQSTRMSTG